MLDSYFFIPGDKPNYLSKISSIKADYFVIDLEDAVSITNKQTALNSVLNLSCNNNMFIRIPFLDKCYSNEQILSLIYKFNGQVVLPKISKLNDIDQIISMANGSDLKMILLIENPSCFFVIPEILQKFSKQIIAIGFGSHDFCSVAGIKHTLEHLTYYKKQLILYSKVYNVDYLDGVDLNLQNFDEFKRECIFAFESGADGKFIIHPKQLQEFQVLEYMTKGEILQLESIYEKVRGISVNDIDVLTIDDKVYEKPQIERIKNLMHRLKKNKL